MACFPRLRTLEISKCPKLLSLPPIPWTSGPCSAKIYQVGSGFERLTYRKDGRSKSRLNIRGNEFLDVLAFDNLTELEELYIEECLPVPLDYLGMLPSVKYLQIRKCGASAKELTLSLYTHFPNLSELIIWNCEKVTWLGVVEQQTPKSSPSASGGEEAIEAAEEGLLLLPPQIQVLWIWDCRELSTAAAAVAGGGRGLQGLRSLRSLHIQGCPKVLVSSSNFPFPCSLQKLHLWNVEGTWTLTPLTNLNELSIYDCGDLRGESLWPLLAQCHLVKLSVLDSPNFFSGFEHHSFGLEKLSTDDIAGALAAPVWRLLSSSLTNLAFAQNDEVEVFTKQQEQALQRLTSLQELEFHNCEKLQSLPAGLSGLPKLKRLEIWSCPAIRSLPKDGLGSSLQDLQIWFCRAIRSLDGLPSSLQDLKIYQCPAIWSLPKNGLPSSLRVLDVVGSGNDELRTQCRKLTGTIPMIKA